MTYLFTDDDEVVLEEWRMLRLPVDVVADPDTLDVFKGDMTPCELRDDVVRKGCVPDLLWVLPSSKLK